MKLLGWKAVRMKIMADKEKKIRENDGGDKERDTANTAAGAGKSCGSAQTDGNGKKACDAGEDPTPEDSTGETSAHNAERGEPSAESAKTAGAKKEKSESAGQNAEDTESAGQNAEDTESAGKNAEDAESTGQKADAEGKDKSQSGESDETKYMRLMADFRNFKKRTEKEKLDIYAYANEKIVAGLLEVVDNFERALDHESTDPAYAEGMRMIFRQLLGVLEDSGLEEIKAHKESFDPNFHNAVMTEDNPEFESGKVTEVLQKGYILNGKVIRPSMVKVNN